MYPDRELRRLAAHKAAVRQDIAFHRAECAAAAARVAGPLERIDRLLESWRKLSPFAKLAAVPLGFMAKRTLFPRMKFLRAALKWGPLVFAAVRGIRAARKR